MKDGADALTVGIDYLIQAHAPLIIGIAARHRLPTIYPSREFADDGGLLAYGVSYPNLYARAAGFIDRIFKGAKPSELPVEQPTKMELVLNLKAADVLGLRFDALLVSADPFLLNQREQIVDLAARHALPAAYQWREFAELGGLMSYGTSIADAYRHAGVYAGRILKGQRVAELPVQQAVKVELVVNLKTARRLGIQLPQSILARADEVIE